MFNQKEDNIFVPPLQSRATRSMPKRSRASCRGVIALAGQRYVFESQLELRTLFQAKMRDDIVDIWDQPTAVAYTDKQGRKKFHTFDFLFTMGCGRKLAIAVRSYARAMSGNFKEELEIIANQLPDGFADEINLITEKDLSKTSTVSASRCLQSQRIQDPEADQVVAEAVAVSSFPTTIEGLVDQAGIFGRGYRALLRMVATGQLVVTNGGSLDYSSVVVMGGS